MACTTKWGATEKKRQMEVPFVRLVRSAAGRGLVTSKFFRRGEVVVEVVGPTAHAPTRTSIHVGGGRHVEDPLGRFVNHSCAPSTRVEGRTLVAERPLVPGTPVTFDYTVTEQRVSAPFQCSECNGTVSGTGPPPCRSGRHPAQEPVPH